MRKISSFLVCLAVSGFAQAADLAQVYRDAEEETFWRTVSTKPDRTLAGLTQRFRDMDKRIVGMEAYVASKEFELNRAIRDLDR